LGKAFLAENMVLILTSCASNSGPKKHDSRHATRVGTAETNSDLSAFKTLSWIDPARRM